MGVFTRWRWLFLNAGMIGSCLVFLLAPATARAGCGGDVHVFRQASDDSLAVHPLSSDSHGTRPFPDGHKPCSGPGCSRNPVAPLQAPTAPPTTDRHEQWGCLPLSQGEPGDAFAAVSPGEHSLLPLDQVAYIFHPPRSI
jgi:hypothetical protein